MMGRRATPRPANVSGCARVVIFDFDGTIADTFLAAYEIFNSLAEEYNFRKIADEELESVRDLSARQLIKYLGIPTRKVPSLSRKGVKALRDRLNTIQPLPGLPELIRSLRENGFRLGIITSNSEENVRAFLDQHQIEGFEFIRSSSRLLGKSSEIKRAMKYDKFSREDAIFVGDEARDIEACHDAGIRCVAVTWGYNSRRALEALTPYRIIDHPEELHAVLAETQTP